MFGIDIAVNDVVDIVRAVSSGYSSWRRCARRVVLSPQSIKSPVVAIKPGRLISLDNVAKLLVARIKYSSCVVSRRVVKFIIVVVKLRLGSF